MNKILETSRLYLREFIPDDAPHFYTMNNDPDVIQYTGDIPFKSLRSAQDFIKNYDAYIQTGMGRYAVLDKTSDTFLGWCGLKYHPIAGKVDVGYRFYKSYWGNGYATESAMAVIQYGFKQLKLPSIVAHAHIENTPSHYVLKKCGMYFVNYTTYGTFKAAVYQIDNIE